MQKMILLFVLLLVYLSIVSQKNEKDAIDKRTKLYNIQKYISAKEVLRNYNKGTQRQKTFAKNTAEQSKLIKMLKDAKNEMEQQKMLLKKMTQDLFFRKQNAQNQKIEQSDKSQMIAIENMKTKMKKNETVIDNLTNNLNMLKNKNVELRDNQSSQESFIKTLNDTISKIESKKQHTIDKLQNAQQKIQKYEKEKTKRNEQLFEQLTQNDLRENTINELQKMNYELTDELKTRKQSQLELMDQLETEKESQLELIDKLETREEDYKILLQNYVLHNEIMNYDKRFAQPHKYVYTSKNKDVLQRNVRRWPTVNTQDTA